MQHRSNGSYPGRLERLLEFRDDPAMSTPNAELSSLLTQLEELTSRVTTIADRFQAGRREDMAGELYQVERSLKAGVRTLGRVIEAIR